MCVDDEVLGHCDMKRNAARLNAMQHYPAQRITPQRNEA
jgi:hypothetical protein